MPTITLSVVPTSEQATAIKAAGPGCCVHHPRAHKRRARTKLMQQLTAAGLPRRIAVTLRWSTTGDPCPRISDDSAVSPAED